MKQRLTGPRIAVALAATVSSAEIAVFAIAAPAAASPAGKVFTGGARALTAPVAVQAAVDDAVISAESEGFYTCQPVGQPQVFETFTDFAYGHAFYAQADVACTP